MNTIATLYQLRRMLGFDAADTSEDSRLLAALMAATTLIERSAARRFSPRLASIEHTVQPDTPCNLILSDDLLALTSLTNGDAASISLSNVQVLPGSCLHLTGGETFRYNETPLNAVTVSGIWGWHDDWENAWRSSGDTVQNNPLSSGAATVTVSDADGADVELNTPRFQAGQLLKIDSEYLRVLAVNTATNVLTVLRGVNGTTAASHTLGTAIAIYQPARDAELACLRVAMWVYREPDTVNGESMPSALRESLRTLRRVRV
jgi:hypothetical protein